VKTSERNNTKSKFTLQKAMGVGTMAAILVGMVVSLARPAQVRDLLDQTKEPFFDLTANTVFTGQLQFLRNYLN
jgi:hypothetical protein